jgi:hypothetical protein
MSRLTPASPGKNRCHPIQTAFHPVFPSILNTMEGKKRSKREKLRSKRYSPEKVGSNDKALKKSAPQIRTTPLKIITFSINQNL